jgi:hypothetical protein
LLDVIKGAAANESKLEQQQLEQEPNGPRPISVQIRKPG